MKKEKQITIKNYENKAMYLYVMIALSLFSSSLFAGAVYFYSTKVLLNFNLGTFNLILGVIFCLINILIGFCFYKFVKFLYVFLITYRRFKKERKQTIQKVKSNKK